mmetsp:Transcript_45616/g.116706  ORF Transcript_45616/g.116706 Transcript_45616/m.116706 type:complete len:210 (+) Transcript_45616:730-1359(+)
MTLTPQPSGKCTSSAALTASGTPSMSTVPSSRSSAFMPPPMSRMVMSKPRAAAMSNTMRERSMASAKEAGFLLPLPTWKATPTTDSPREAAWSSRAAASSMVSTPYLLPRPQRASGSSARMRSRRRVSGECSAVLISSLALSNTETETPRAAAWRMSRGSLQQLANTMRSGTTPSPSTRSTSPRLAQSKPAPHAASAESSPGLWLHFTA